MSAQCETTGKKAAGAPMGVFERFLTVWVFLCIGVGILLGQLLPSVFHAVGAMEVRVDARLRELALVGDELVQPWRHRKAAVGEREIADLLVFIEIETAEIPAETLILIGKHPRLIDLAF